MPTKIEKDAITGRETTGHEWDGIRELNTPLPKWWVYTFYACIGWAAVYAVLYPSIPWVNAHTAGALGFSQREEVTKTIAAAAAEQAGYRERIRSASLDEIR